MRISIFPAVCSVCDHSLLFEWIVKMNGIGYQIGTLDLKFKPGCPLRSCIICKMYGKIQHEFVI